MIKLLRKISITEMIINLDELDNSDDLKDGRPSNELLTYHVTDDKEEKSYARDTSKFYNPGIQKSL